MKKLALNTKTLHRRAGFISPNLLIVLAVIAGGTGLVAYEWRHAHGHAKHHASSAEHHHHHKHGDKKHAGTEQQ